VVQKDEFENGDEMLNFGHTLGHAIETQYELSHGQAVSLGMIYACKLSEQVLGFPDTHRGARSWNNDGLPGSCIIQYGQGS
jgi:3-dehydroquinate synthase